MVRKNPVDVVAAIATPPGRGGIGIVRLSGTDLELFCKSFLGFVPPARRATLARFLDAHNNLIDEGLALYFPAPQSFTGDDVLELHGHGGAIVMQRLLQRCMELGVRIAEPGEFTKRAFLNGKIDLIQAEAIADLIEASNMAAAQSAIHSLKGEFSKRVNVLCNTLIDLRMSIEASIDFPEEELEKQSSKAILAALGEIEIQIGKLLTSSEQGNILKNGLKVTLVGQPNVGKSSLLNRLLGEERAIVTAIPGTTRDSLQGTIEFNGLPICFIDTAGLRETEDPIEKIGIERSWSEIDQADVILHVLDAQNGKTMEDRKIAERFPGGTYRVSVFNKVDLLNRQNEVTKDKEGVFVSAKTGQGIEQLLGNLVEFAGWKNQPEDIFLARQRHIEALQKAHGHVLAGQNIFTETEFLAEELRQAQQALQTVTGEFTSDDLLGEIFSRFCIGK